jgi:hypothetical protein
VRRTFLLVLLLAIYLASHVRSLVGGVVRRGEFDPFLPAARALEQRIGEGRLPTRFRSSTSSSEPIRATRRSPCGRRACITD